MRNPDDGLYNLYVIDPSEQQILRYSPAQDGSGYPGAASGYLTTPQDVSQVTSMYIDGDIYLADDGRRRALRLRTAAATGPPRSRPTACSGRPRPTASSPRPATRGEGTMYGYDPGSDRFIAFDKASGRYQAQYRIVDGGPDWADVRAFYVVNRAAGQAPLLYWIDARTDRDRRSARTLPSRRSPSAAPALSPGASPAGSGEPTAKPKPTPKPAP